MITATLFFENGIDVCDLTNYLQGLPERIKPTYFTEDEGKIVKVNVLSDKPRFQKFRKRNRNGFFLYAENKTFYDISTRRIGSVEITLYLDDCQDSDLVAVFFERLAHYKPVFGFACDDDEYKHRNRYYTTLGKNHIEDWIGRSIEKYISGVYWQTLLSDELLGKHSVKLVSLSPEAFSTETLGDGSFHLLKFYENPEDWRQNAKRLDDLCERTDGLFSKKSVESAVSGVSNYLDYDDIIAEWR